mmetsp:Transcript_125756/g.363813  ORF Transcript_125756/g.363813 Transcript_125756/m.363813 type:complete len:254 (-) Transcript_125756:302-1063(-)
MGGGAGKQQPLLQPPKGSLPAPPVGGSDRDLTTMDSSTRSSTPRRSDVFDDMGQLMMSECASGELDAGKVKKRSKKSVTFNLPGHIEDEVRQRTPNRDEVPHSITESPTFGRALAPSASAPTLSTPPTDDKRTRRRASLLRSAGMSAQDRRGMSFGDWQDERPPSPLLMMDFAPPNSLSNTSLGNYSKGFETIPLKKSPSTPDMGIAQNRSSRRRRSFTDASSPAPTVSLFPKMAVKPSKNLRQPGVLGLMYG